MPEKNLARRVVAISALCCGITVVSAASNDGVAKPVQTPTTGNPFAYLHAFDECLISPALPGQVSTRWRAEHQLGEVVLVDLARIGGRADLVKSILSRYNSGTDADTALRMLPRDMSDAIVDVNGDGALDLIRSYGNRSETLVWSADEKSWTTVSFPVAAGARAVLWGATEHGGPATILVRSIGMTGAWQFVDGRWQPAHQLTAGLEIDGQRLFTGSHRGVRLLDLDNDGCCELVAAGRERRGVLRWNGGQNRWVKLPFGLPDGVAMIDDHGNDAGLRFVDVDEDGDQDIIFSDGYGYSVHLFDSLQTGWSSTLVTAKRSLDAVGIPPISLAGHTTGTWYDPASRTVQPPHSKLTETASNTTTLSLRDELLKRHLRHLEQVAAEGFAALVSNDGDSDEWYNYQGQMVPNHHLRQTQVGAKLIWETPPAHSYTADDADTADEPLHFVFLGAIGYRSEPTTAGYALDIDGQEKLRFDVTEHLTRWQSDNHDTSLVFHPTWTSSQDAAGFFYLSLSAELVSAGEPVRVAVRSLGSGSRRWFALHPVKDVVARQPGRHEGAIATEGKDPTTYQVGAAAIDVTPGNPIRLRGYSGRNTESAGIVQRLWAKALVIKSPQRSPALLITLDNCLIPAYLRDELATRLQRRCGLHSDRFAITATHTHSGPMLARMSETLYCHPLPAQHRAHIEQYTAELIANLEQVARDAFASQQPARLLRTQGTVGFAQNRRTKGGPVDHDLPVLVAQDAAGNVRAVYVSYACHCTTLSHNKVSGDWAGYAQEQIERAFPGAIALVSVGCGADANPIRGGENSDETAARHGQEISNEVNRLIQHDLRPVSGELDTRFSTVELQLAKIPSRAEWEQRATKDADRGGTVGYHARIHLQRLDHGEPIKTRVPLPVQTWTFSDDLAIVFLGGEVVVDYSLRLKRELDRNRVWINSYANDVPCYIPSERVLREGGYEGGGAMIFHDWAAPFLPGLEKKIVDEVHYQLGQAYRLPHAHLGDGQP